MNAEMLRRRRRRYSSECGVRRGRLGHGHGRSCEGGMGGTDAAAILAATAGKRRQASWEGDDDSALALGRVSWLGLFNGAEVLEMDEELQRDRGGVVASSDYDGFSALRDESTGGFIQWRGTAP